ncbi:MAG: Aldehyde dehydrogenase, partial [uncultured Rubrobacteraceae bacterium]
GRTGCSRPRARNVHRRRLGGGGREAARHQPGGRIDRRRGAGGRRGACGDGPRGGQRGPEGVGAEERRGAWGGPAGGGWWDPGAGGGPRPARRGRAGQDDHRGARRGRGCGRLLRLFRRLRPCPGRRDVRPRREGRAPLHKGRPLRRCGRHHPLELPGGELRPQGGARDHGRQRHRPQAARGDPAHGAGHRRDHRRGRGARRRCQRRHRRGTHRRQRARAEPPDGDDHRHRLRAGRARDPRRRRRKHHPGLAGARWQGAVYSPRRRRPGSRGPERGERPLLELRPGLHLQRAHLRAQRPLRRVRGALRPGGGRHKDRRPDARGRPDGTEGQRARAGEGGGDGRGRRRAGGSRGARRQAAGGAGVREGLLVRADGPHRGEERHGDRAGRGVRPRAPDTALRRLRGGGKPRQRLALRPYRLRLYLRPAQGDAGHRRHRLRRGLRQQDRPRATPGLSPGVPALRHGRRRREVRLRAVLPPQDGLPPLRRRHRRRAAGEPV